MWTYLQFVKEPRSISSTVPITRRIKEFYDVLDFLRETVRHKRCVARSNTRLFNLLLTKDANWRFLVTFCNNQRCQMMSTDFELQYSKKKEQTMLHVIYIDRTTLCVYVIYSLLLFIVFL